MQKMYDVVVIGGGVVGCAVLRELAKYRLKVALLERCGDVAEGISKANSGVLHAGINVRSGSLKARMNLEGLRNFPHLAQELGVDCRICGKMVVARSEEELPYLEKLLRQGLQNGCTGLSLIPQTRMRELEPRVSGRWALLSESTGIITPFQLTIAFAENAVQNGAEIFMNSPVARITPLPAGGFLLATPAGKTFRTTFVINSAGNQAAEVANLLQPGTFRTYPCRGEYYITDKRAGALLKMAVYPVPPLDGSGLGVHLTPTINGNLLIGPSAEYVDDAEDLQTTRRVMDVLRAEMSDLLPELAGQSLIKSYSGMRPKLFQPGQNSTFEDFHIAPAEGYPGFINLIGIESPGLTSSPAIARYLTQEIIGSQRDLAVRPDFHPVRRGIVRASGLPTDERERLIQSNPAYAEIICRCEQISRAEIEAALDNPLGARTLNAIKKRTHALMGRCQGGFCLPNIVRIMQGKGIKPEEIRRRSDEDYVFPGSKP